MKPDRDEGGDVNLGRIKLLLRMTEFMNGSLALKSSQGTPKKSTTLRTLPATLHAYPAQCRQSAFCLSPYVIWYYVAYAFQAIGLLSLGMSEDECKASKDSFLYREIALW